MDRIYKREREGERETEHKNVDSFFVSREENCLYREGQRGMRASVCVRVCAYFRVYVCAKKGKVRSVSGEDRGCQVVDQSKGPFNSQLPS